jgi:dihydrodipicolinate synthase/N-acetylneuraminate lyase
MAVRHFVERSGLKVVLYIKDEAYISPKVVSELVKDEFISWIKYAVVREYTAQDSYLQELIEYVDPSMIVSGIGEQPAITHLNGFGLAGYTSGCVCVAPSKSMKMLELIKSGDIQDP